MTNAFRADDVDLDPDRARALIESGEVQLVDVREPREWEAGRIAGARHVELERLASEADSIDRERPVLFYCRVGSRSGMAANAFRRAGYDAYSMIGGLAEWDRARLSARARGRHGRRPLSAARAGRRARKERRAVARPSSPPHRPSANPSASHP